MSEEPHPLSGPRGLRTCSLSHLPSACRQHVPSITLTFSWTLTNAQTPTENLPLLKSTKSRSGKETQVKRILVPVPHLYSSCWRRSTPSLGPCPQNTPARSQPMPRKGNEAAATARKHTHPRSVV